MARKAATQKPPTVTADRAVKALTQQLDTLQKIKVRRYDEADAEQAEWEQLTQSLIEAAFGDPSASLDRFRMVVWGYMGRTLVRNSVKAILKLC